MQIFLPYPDFNKSVACLDKSRLGNQIWRECKTLLNGGWKHHPVAKMWKDYHAAMALYGIAGVQELLRRNDISQIKAHELCDYFCQFCTHVDGPMPPFIGNVHFHKSHRLNLLYKDPTWYRQFFNDPIPQTKPEYIWPIPK